MTEVDKKVVEAIKDCTKKVEEIYEEERKSKKRMMFLIDVKNDAVGISYIDPEHALEEYHEKLNCDLIDITERKIGDKYYDIICDDEGLLKENAIPSAIDKDKKPMLVGNLLICNVANDEGEEVPLEISDVHNIYHHLMKGEYEDKNGEKKSFPVVVCEY